MMRRTKKMGRTEPLRGRRDLRRSRWLARLLALCGLFVCVSLGGPLVAGAATSETLSKGRNPTISPDGRTVAFEAAVDLDPRDEDGDGIGSNDGGGLFLWDTATGVATRVVAADADLVPAEIPALSGDGSVLALMSRFDFAPAAGTAAPTTTLAPPLLAGTALALFAVYVCHCLIPVNGVPHTGWAPAILTLWSVVDLLVMA